MANDTDPARAASRRNVAILAIVVVVGIGVVAWKLMEGRQSLRGASESLDQDIRLMEKMNHTPATAAAKP